MSEHVLNLLSTYTLRQICGELESFLHDQFLDVKAGTIPNLDLEAVKTYQLAQKVLKEKDGD